jgi:hypothetical protein
MTTSCRARSAAALLCACLLGGCGAALPAAPPTTSATPTAPPTTSATPTAPPTASAPTASAPSAAKIDSHLLAAIQRGSAAGVQIDGRGRALVDITAAVDAALLEELHRRGAEVVTSSERLRSVRARVPLDQIEPIAGLPAVIFIQPAQSGTTNQRP